MIAGRAAKKDRQRASDGGRQGRREVEQSRRRGRAARVVIPFTIETSSQAPSDLLMATESRRHAHTHTHGGREKEDGPSEDCPKLADWAGSRRDNGRQTSSSSCRPRRMTIRQPSGMQERHGPIPTGSSNTTGSSWRPRGRSCWRWRRGRREVGQGPRLCCRPLALWRATLRPTPSLTLARLSPQPYLRRSDRAQTQVQTVSALSSSPLIQLQSIEGDSNGRTTACLCRTRAVLPPPRRAASSSRTSSEACTDR
jgi:hypothetical protein